MVAKTNWHRYGTKLRHCHPRYTFAANAVGNDRLMRGGKMNTQTVTGDSSQPEALCLADYKQHSTTMNARMTVFH